MPLRGAATIPRHCAAGAAAGHRDAPRRYFRRSLPLPLRRDAFLVSFCGSRDSVRSVCIGTLGHVGARGTVGFFGSIRSSGRFPVFRNRLGHVPGSPAAYRGRTARRRRCGGCLCLWQSLRLPQSSMRGSSCVFESVGAFEKRGVAQGFDAADGGGVRKELSGCIVSEALRFGRRWSGGRRARRGPYGAWVARCVSSISRRAAPLRNVFSYRMILSRRFLFWGAGAFPCGA